MKNKLLRALIPLFAWGLSLAVPAVPAPVWSGMFTAILDGDLTLDHIKEFLAAHGIKTYTPKDILTPDVQLTNTNMVSGGYDDEGPKSM